MTRCYRVDRRTLESIPGSGTKPVLVTAYDARDVGPLVEAARRGLEDLEDVHAPSVGPLQAALAPFDSEESG